MKRRVLLQGAGLALALPGTGTRAQTSLRLVLSLPAGSAIDFVTRVITPGFGQRLGQAVVVDNKAGGNGIIAVQDVLRSPPDGNTLMLNSLSVLAVNTATVKNLPYDPRRDFTPISGAYLTNHVLMVKSTFPARNLPEFIAYAKKHPGKVSIGHSTSLVQVQIAALGKMAGIDVLPVPYKGTPATVTDVIGGTLDATLLDPGSALAQVRGGQMRALGVSSLKRNPITPDWPAISETLPGYDFPTWSALVGPKGMPADLVERIHLALADVLKQKDVIDRLAQAGFVPWVTGPAALRTYIDAEVARWASLAREANIQPE